MLSFFGVNRYARCWMCYVREGLSKKVFYFISSH